MAMYANTRQRLERVALRSECGRKELEGIEAVQDDSMFGDIQAECGIAQQREAQLIRRGCAVFGAAQDLPEGSVLPSLLLKNHAENRIVQGGCTIHIDHTCRTEQGNRAALRV